MKILTMAALAACFTTAAAAAPFTVPFDFSHHAIGLDVTVKGTALHMLLDTGVDPSGIDIARAQALKLPVDRGNGGEATGEGNAAQAQIFPATIEGLAIAGRDFPAFEAAAMPMATLSAGYGRTLDGVLGYSFLNNRIWLIDYPAARLSLLERPADAWDSVKRCKARWTLPLKQMPDDNIPVVTDFRIGPAKGAITLDTGSNRGIALTPAALDAPGLKAVLEEKGEVAATGARGGTRYKTYLLKDKIGFGPFELPAGELVALRANPAGDALANVGNQVFAKMKLKMLLNYKARLMTFYGRC